MRSMVRTDVFDRGIPWTLLILRAGRMPDDLNVRWTQRLSILGVAALLLLTAVCAALYGGQFLAPAAAILLLATGSYWVIEAKHRESASVPLAITASIIALALMSWAIDRWEPLLLVSAGYLGLAAREWVGASHGPWKRPLGWLYGIYLVAGTAYLASMVPVTPMISLLAVTVVLVVTLNIRFYRFLCGRLGTLGGIAAVPLHLLYFLYSGLSFAAGSAVALKSRRASLGR